MEEVYLALLFDCFDDAPIAWKQEKSLNSKLTNFTLIEAYKITHKKIS